jgi:hypothetical protein
LIKTWEPARLSDPAILGLSTLSNFHRKVDDSLLTSLQGLDGVICGRLLNLPHRWISPQANGGYSKEKRQRVDTHTELIALGIPPAIVSAVIAMMSQQTASEW